MISRHYRIELNVRVSKNKYRKKKCCLVRTWEKKTYASKEQVHFVVREVTFSAHSACEPSYYIFHNDFKTKSKFKANE